MSLLAWSAALALSLQGLASMGAPLAPMGKWLVEGEGDLCVLSHAFGTDAAAMTLAFRPFPMNNQMEAVLLLPKRQGAQRDGKASLTLTPTGQVFDATFAAFGIKNNMRAVHVYLDRDLVDALGSATQLTIAADGRSVALTLPSAGRALKVLNQCETTMLKDWGVDPELDRKLTAKLSGNPGRYFGPSSYPSEALRARASGRVVALLSVTGEGKVATCRVVRSSLNAALDKATCSSASHIRYVPARGEEGKPVASWTLLPVVWQLPS